MLQEALLTTSLVSERKKNPIVTLLAGFFFSLEYQEFSLKVNERYNGFSVNFHPL